eukprot:4047193-Prymnesium_polylepis.1
MSQVGKRVAQHASAPVSQANAAGTMPDAARYPNPCRQLSPTQVTCCRHWPDAAPNLCRQCSPTQKTMPAP